MYSLLPTRPSETHKDPLFGQRTTIFQPHPIRKNIRFRIKWAIINRVAERIYIILTHLLCNYAFFQSI